VRENASGQQIGEGDREQDSRGDGNGYKAQFGADTDSEQTEQGGACETRSR
jgi:hypothetical protein